MTTDKRNGVPTLRAAAAAVLEYITFGGPDGGVHGNELDARALVLAAALRTDRDLSARRTRRRRGTDVWAPVTPTPERGKRNE